MRKKKPSGYVPPHKRDLAQGKKYVKPPISDKVPKQTQKDLDKAALVVKVSSGGYKFNEANEQKKAKFVPSWKQPKKEKDLTLDFTREDLINQDFLLGGRFLRYVQVKMEELSTRAFCDHVVDLQKDAYEAGNYAVAAAANFILASIKNGSRGKGNGPIEAVTEFETYLTKTKESFYVEELQDRLSRYTNMNNMNKIIEIMNLPKNPKEKAFFKNDKLFDNMHTSIIKEISSQAAAAYSKGAFEIYAITDKILSQREKILAKVFEKALDSKIDIQAINAQFTENYDTEFSLSVLYEVTGSKEIDIKKIKDAAALENCEELLYAFKKEDEQNVATWIEDQSVNELEEFINESSENAEMVKEQIFLLNYNYLNAMLNLCDDPEDNLNSLKDLLLEEKDYRKESLSQSLKYEEENNIYKLNAILKIDNSSFLLFNEILSEQDSEYIQGLLEYAASKHCMNLQAVIGFYQKEMNDVRDSDMLDLATLNTEKADSFDLPSKGISRTREGSTKSNSSNNSDDSACFSDYSSNSGSNSLSAKNLDKTAIIGEVGSPFDAFLSVEANT